MRSEDWTKRPKWTVTILPILNAEMCGGEPSGRSAHLSPGSRCSSPNRFDSSVARHSRRDKLAVNKGARVMSPPNGHASETNKSAPATGPPTALPPTQFTPEEIKKLVPKYEGPFDSSLV